MAFDSQKSVRAARYKPLDVKPLNKALESFVRTTGD